MPHIITDGPASVDPTNAQSVSESVAQLIDDAAALAIEARAEAMSVSPLEFGRAFVARREVERETLRALGLPDRWWWL